jgi:hypothetical protein
MKTKMLFAVLFLTILQAMPVFALQISGKLEGPEIITKMQFGKKVGLYSNKSLGKIIGGGYVLSDFVGFRELWARDAADRYIKLYLISRKVFFVRTNKEFNGDSEIFLYVENSKGSWVKNGKKFSQINYDFIALGLGTPESKSKTYSQANNYAKIKKIGYYSLKSRREFLGVVTFKVNSSCESRITYSIGNRTQQIDQVEDWREDFSANVGDFIYVSAQANCDAFISVEIYMNGIYYDYASSLGKYVIASLSAKFQLP